MKDPLGNPNVDLCAAYWPRQCVEKRQESWESVSGEISTRSGGDAFCCGRVLADFRRCYASRERV